MESPPSALPKLPACQRCYNRKIKCDNKRPSCDPCVESGSQCMVVCLADEEPVSRALIHELEQKQAELPAVPPSVNTAADPHATAAAPTVESTTSIGSDYVAEGGGLSFMRTLFLDADWRSRNAALLQNLANGPRAIEATIQPSELPSAAQARKLFNNYLSGSNVLSPVLLRRDVEDLYSRVFEAGIPPSSADSFRALMIIAVGGVKAYRRGDHHKNPYGYYLTAMKHFDSSFLSRGLSAIQDLMLISRFGIYHHIGTSIWDIMHLCIRMCIEAGLHRKSYKLPSLLHQQLQRRVFWECYIIDRYSSLLLGRPFAIADRDITIGLPINADDDEITSLQTRYLDLDAVNVQDPSRLTDMTVFLYCIRLRRLTSKIHTAFFRIQTKDVCLEDPLASFGRIHMTSESLLRDLKAWRDSSPLFAQPRSLYESPAWFDFLHARECLIVLRKAVDLVPKRSGSPPTSLLKACSKSAAQVIQAYSKMFGSDRPIYTRSYFQTIFVAGLSIMYCLSTAVEVDGHLLAMSSEALQAGERILRDMAVEMPDATNYILIFEALFQNLARKSRELQHLLSDIPTAEQTNHGQGMTNAAPASEAAPHPERTHVLQPGGGREVVLTTNGLMQQTTFDSGADHATRGMLYDAWGPQDSGLDAVPWSFFQDDALWTVADGLGEYAYGVADGQTSLLDGFDLDGFNWDRFST